MPYSIMLDAGHGGKDPGAVYNGRQEKDDALALTLAIGEILQERGIDVLYTRTTDVYESPYQKAMEANAAGVDFFVSIHRNSYPTDNAVSGVESLIYDRSGIKLEMAENINDQLESIGFVNLGVKERPGLVVLRRTKMPAVLVEVGFINSDTDNQLFDDNFDDIALAIAEGILETLGQSSGPDSSGYTVQVGSYRNPANADRLVSELREQDFPIEIAEGDGLFRVMVGAYPTLEEAVEMERRLKRAGYQTLVISR
ncbi:MAG TPA: N-acetylmuramoyl-L-alanine amidase [Candidatus Mediterraneibacter excrementigallinarum]|nr:N-acetylmuramoyl-L-alanine amidase [Candidatus Mediterraneibacter excrementigallinarum]